MAAVAPGVVSGGNPRALRAADRGVRWRRGDARLRYTGADLQAVMYSAQLEAVHERLGADDGGVSVGVGGAGADDGVAADAPAVQTRAVIKLHHFEAVRGRVMCALASCRLLLVHWRRRALGVTTGRRRCTLNRDAGAAFVTPLAVGQRSPALQQRVRTVPGRRASHRCGAWRCVWPCRGGIAA